MKVQIINGPNINLLGKREPSIYGAMSFETYYKRLVTLYPDIEFAYFQSNIEGELINKIHEVGFDYDGIILNAGVGSSHISLYHLLACQLSPMGNCFCLHISQVILFPSE